MPYDDYEDYEDEEEYEDSPVEINFDDYDDSSWSAAAEPYDSASGYSDPFDPNATVNVKGMNVRGGDLLQDSYMQQDLGNEREGRGKFEINLAQPIDAALGLAGDIAQQVPGVIENRINPTRNIAPAVEWTADRINDVINGGDNRANREAAQRQAGQDLDAIGSAISSATEPIRNELTKVHTPTQPSMQTPTVDYSGVGQSVYDAVSGGAQPPSRPLNLNTPSVDYGVKFESNNPLIKGAAEALGGANSAAVDALNKGAAGVDRLVHGRPQTTASAAEDDYYTVYNGSKKPAQSESRNSNAGVTKDDFAKDRGPDLSAVQPGDDPYTTKYFPQGIIDDETGASTPVPAPPASAGVGDAAPQAPKPLTGSPDTRRAAPAPTTTAPSRPSTSQAARVESAPDTTSEEPRSEPTASPTPTQSKQNPTSLDDMIDHIMKSQAANNEVNQRAIDANSKTQVSLGNASNPTPGSMNEPAFASAVNVQEANEFRGPDGRLYVEYTDDQGNKRTVPSSTWFGRNENDDQTEKKFARKFNKGMSPEQRRKDRKKS